MQKQVAHQLEIIVEQVANLLEGDLRVLPETQRDAVELIGLYTSNLCDTLNQYDQTNLELERVYLRSEMIDTLTTMFGYAEMLVDGWIGTVAIPQQEQLQSLHDQIRLLIPVIRRTAKSSAQAAKVG